MRRGALYAPLLISGAAFLKAPTHGIVRQLAITGRASKNVALKKGKADAFKAKLYSRLGIKILMAAKNKGSDPSKNLDLARALREAATHKLPKENVERALKKAADKATQDYSRGIYEVRSSGCNILVWTLTDNANRAVKHIKEKVGKAEKAKFVTDGSVLFRFVSRGVLRQVEDKVIEGDTIIEHALLAAIDVDVVDDPMDGRRQMLITSPENLQSLQEVLAEAGLQYDGELDMAAEEKISLVDAEREKVLELISSLEDLDDVDTVFSDLDYAE